MYIKIAKYLQISAYSLVCFVLYSYLCRAKQLIILDLLDIRKPVTKQEQKSIS